MSYTAADGPPAPSSLDGQPLDDDLDDGVCVAYGSSSNNNSGRDKYKRYTRSADKQCTDRRSSSRDHYTKRRRRDRSRHRRSRSRSTSRRRHYERKRKRDRRSRHSKSRSRSRSRRSRSRDYHSRSRRSRSRGCRCNGSCTCSSNSSSYSDRDTSSLYHARKYVREVPKDQDYIRKVYAKHDNEDDDDDAPVQENTFKNDGSFLEMFKKMQQDKAEEQKKEEPAPEGAGEQKKSVPIFGKRRGGRVLKTGLVQKIKSTAEVEEEPKDAWSVYMKEVKRYKEACCDDDSKTRPLVK